MYSEVLIDKHLSEEFLIQKQGDALSPLLFNFALEYAIRKVQKNKEGFELNETHHFLVDTDYIVLDENINITKKNIKALLNANKEVGLEVNVEKTKYMLRSRHQTTGRNHYINTATKSFENVAKFKCVETTVTNQNSIHE
jgi:hypothetical protein